QRRLNLLAGFGQTTPIADVEPRVHRKAARKRGIGIDAEQRNGIANRFLVPLETRIQTGALVQCDAIPGRDPQYFSEALDRISVVIQLRECGGSSAPRGGIVPFQRNGPIEVSKSVSMAL